MDVSLSWPVSGDIHSQWPPKWIFVFLLACSHTTKQPLQMPCEMDHRSVLPE